MRVLTINTGSSSLKAAVYADRATRLVFDAEAERIGQGGSLRVVDGKGTVLLEQQQHFNDHTAAVEALLDWLAGRDEGRFEVAGHRIVYGGPTYSAPRPIDEPMLEALRRLVPLDPDHLPQAIAAVETLGRRQAGLRQFACFDTWFHHAMPPAARTLPLPRRFADDGVVRYGFHGLSYEYLSAELHKLDPRAGGLAVLAHLGSGCSMAAVRGGTGVDTTMGFTPTGGLMMSTRSGDLDPGVLLHLLDGYRMAPADVGELVNRRSGLLGVSGTSGDMRDLLAREAEDQHAAEAIELFCYGASKAIGALAAALGGLDTLVFAGGIGEHAAPIRERICAPLAFLGVRLDAERNRNHAPVISPDGGPATVRVIPTDEDIVIARHTIELSRGRQADV